jgi:hypothetical protein
VQGGAIYYNYKKPVLQDIVNTNNSAPYGPDLASYAVKIRMMSKTTDEMQVDNVGSDIVIPQTLYFELLDYDNQVMVLNNINQIVITPVNANISSVSGTNSELLKNGVASFDSLKAIAVPGSSGVMYRATSKAIDTQKLNEIYGSNVNQNLISFNFRKCQPGEFIKDGNKCDVCSGGSYSFDWNSKICHTCMNDAVCLGGTMIEVRSEYWRFTTNSTKIIEWINKDACKGGYHPNNEHPVECKAGYKGILCSEWDIKDGEKYQKVSDYEWEKCPSIVVNSIRVIGLGILVFIFFMILIAINVRKTKDSEVSILMRIMTNYLQIITTSSSFSSKYPTVVVDSLAPVQRFGGASDTFLSFDCFITDYEIKGPFPENSYFKLFLTAILPLILTMIVGIIWTIVHFVSRKWAPDLKRCLIISFISIMFLLHPKLTEQSISVFRWVTIDDEKSRMRIDTKVDWYSNEHLSWCVFLGLPILVVYVIGAPLLALILIAKNIRKSPQNKIRQYFLIFYQGLKHDKFYWEFVNTLRKVFLVFFLLLSGYSQVLLSTALLVASARLQIKLKPYKNMENSKIELMAITAGIVVLLSSLVFQQEESIGFLNVIAIIFVIVVNLIFIFEWLYKMVLEFEDRHRLIRLVSWLWPIL